MHTACTSTHLTHAHRLRAPRALSLHDSLTHGCSHTRGTWHIATAPGGTQLLHLSVHATPALSQTSLQRAHNYIYDLMMGPEIWSSVAEKQGEVPQLLLRTIECLQAASNDEACKLLGVLTSSSFM